MGAFTSEWLALREPADRDARSGTLAHWIAEGLIATGASILDLASGAGSNPRYLIERLPPQQRWLLVDHDADLLGDARTGTADWAARHNYAVVANADELILEKNGATCHLSTRPVELATFGGAPYHTDARGGPAWGGIFAGRTVVTASALLDLVSERWLQMLAARCCERRAAVLFALTYDGRLACTPEEPEDATIRALVARHQHTDKGFGPALGPDATSVAARCFSVLGYEVRRERSDWVLGPEMPELQEQLVIGWAEAATEIAPAHASSIGAWKQRRLAHIGAGQSHIVVGHEDIAGVLPSA